MAFADPPFCEAYKIEVNQKDGNHITGFFQILTSQYGKDSEYHTAGSLQPEDFFKMGAQLNLYEEVHQFSIPKNIQFIGLPLESRKSVERDSIASIRILSVTPCSKGKEYDYFWGRVLILPRESIWELKKKRLNFVKVYSEGEDYACWIAAKNDVSKQKRVKIFNEIQQKKSAGVMVENDELWRKYKTLLLCESLVW